MSLFKDLKLNLKYSTQLLSVISINRFYLIDSFKKKILLIRLVKIHISKLFQI